MYPDPSPSNDSTPYPSDRVARNLSIELGKWSHSHEEDHDGLMVFRPESFRFPRSRGRMSFILEGDGRGTYIPIGADDRNGTMPARWSMDSTGIMSAASTVTTLLRIHGGTRELLCAEVHKATPEELLLRILPRT